MTTTSTLSGLRICLVGTLPPPDRLHAHGAILVRCLKREGVQVRQVNAAHPRLRAVPLIGPLLLPLVILTTVTAGLLLALPRSDVVHLLADSQQGGVLPTALVMVLGRLFRRRVVVTYEAGSGGAFLDRYPRLGPALLKRFDAAAVPSREQQEQFQRYGLEPAVCPDIVELARFPMPLPRRRSPLVLWLGDLVHETNPAMAIRGLARLRLTVPEARLLMVGQGPLLSSLRALAFELGVADAVSRKPWMPFHRRRLALQTAGALWQTAPESAVPQDLLAGLASGTAVVGVNAGSTPDLLEDGVDALLVTPHDYLALAAATTQVLRRPVLARGLAENARLAVERHDWSNVRQIVAGLYGVAVEAEERAEGAPPEQPAPSPKDTATSQWIEPELAERTEFLWRTEDHPHPQEET